MKKTIGLVCLCFLITLSACSQEQKGIKITGQIKGLGQKEGERLIFTKNDGTKLSPGNLNTVTLDENGSFEIIDTLKQDGVVMCALMHMTFVRHSGGGGSLSQRGFSFAAQNGDHIKIKASSEDFKWGQVSGNRHNDYLSKYYRLIKDNKIKLDEINKELRELKKNDADERQINKLESKISTITEKNNEFVLDFIKKDPQQPMNAFILLQESRPMSYKMLKSGFESLGEKVKVSEYGENIKKQIFIKKNAEAAAEGKMAADFEKVDKNGNLIRLSDFRGKKYVLLDFWGSWCGACRAGHPHLKDLYEEYKDEGFEIIGIAEENNSRNGREKWLKAIEDDGIPWLQILNDEGREKTDVVKLYGVTSFPTKILIDKEGKIIVKETGSRSSGGAKEKKGAGTASAQIKGLASAASASSGSSSGASASSARSASASSSSGGAAGAAAASNMKISQGSGAITLGGNSNMLPKKKSNKSRLDAKLEEIFKK